MFIEPEHNVPANLSREPYFEDEIIGEAYVDCISCRERIADNFSGFSMENAVCGNIGHLG